MIGKTENMTLSQIKNFGFPKLSEIWKEIVKLMKYLKVQAGLF